MEYLTLRQYLKAYANSLQFFQLQTQRQEVIFKRLQFQGIQKELLLQNLTIVKAIFSLHQHFKA
jgi:hypothetical protein